MFLIIDLPTRIPYVIIDPLMTLKVVALPPMKEKIGVGT